MRIDLKADVGEGRPTPPRWVATRFQWSLLHPTGLGRASCAPATRVRFSWIDLAGGRRCARERAERLATIAASLT